MTLISCPECAAQVSDRSISCVKCGCPLRPAATNAAAPPEQQQPPEQPTSSEVHESTLPQADPAPPAVPKKQPGRWRRREQPANQQKSKPRDPVNIGCMVFVAALAAVGIGFACIKSCTIDTTPPSSALGSPQDDGQLPTAFCGTWTEHGYYFDGDPDATPDFMQIGTATPSSITLSVDLTSRSRVEKTTVLSLKKCKIIGGTKNGKTEMMLQFVDQPLSLMLVSLPKTQSLDPVRYPNKYNLRVFDNKADREISRWIISINQ